MKKNIVVCKKCGKEFEQCSQCNHTICPTCRKNLSVSSK